MLSRTPVFAFSDRPANPGLIVFPSRHITLLSSALRKRSTLRTGFSEIHGRHRGIEKAKEMSTPNQNPVPEKVGETTASRPGIKFVLCVVAVAILIAVVVIRG